MHRVLSEKVAINGHFKQVYHVDENDQLQGSFKTFYRKRLTDDRNYLNDVLHGRSISYNSLAQNIVTNYNHSIITSRLRSVPENIRLIIFTSNEIPF